MNKIQNNNFLLALLGTGSDPFNAYHYFLFLPMVASNAGKKKETSLRKKLELALLRPHTPETLSTLCGCLRFSSILLSPHTKTLWTRPQ